MGLRQRVTVALVVLVAAAHDASASVSIAVPFDTLVATSTAAVLVTPVTQTSRWEGGRVFTYTSVHVDQQVAGDALTGEVSVRTMGGDVGTIGQVVEGEAVLTVGRPSLLFLHGAAPVPGVEGSGLVSQAPCYVVTARAQGQFPVVVDAAGESRVRRSSGVGATMAPRRGASGGVSAPVLAGDVLHGAKVADARDAIGRVWSRVHAP